MKPYTVTAIFAAACLFAAPAVQASPAEEYISLMDKTIELMDDLGEVLFSVKDKETADAAAPKAKELLDRLRPAVVEMQDVVNDELAEETLGEIMQAYEANLKKYEGAQVKLFTAHSRLQQTEPPYYGSEDLKAVFSQEGKAE